MHSAWCRTIWVVLILFGVSATVACNRDPAAKEARFLARGKKFLDAKEYQRAALEFSNAAKLNSARADTWYQMGMAFLGAGRIREAAGAFRRAVDLDPSHSAAQIRLSALMVQSPDPATLEGAIKRLDQVLSSQANEPEALDLKAVAELKLNQPEDAEKHLRQVLEKFPGRLRSSATLAALQFAKKDLDGAEKTLQAAVAQAPQSVEAALALAQLYTLERKFGPAEEETRRALRIDGSSAAALLALGRLQVFQGKLDDADQTYRRVATLPKKDLSHVHAAFLLARGKTDEGIAELDKLAKASPGDREAQLRLIAANLMAGKEQAAVALIDGVLKKNAKDTDALLLRSRIRLRSGKTGDAEADIQQVLHFKPDSADAHYELARVYAATGRERMQEQELTEVVRLRPDVLAARADLARLRLASGHADIALQTLDAAPKSQKASPAFTIERNWVLLALNRLDEASAAIDGALRVVNAPKLLLQRGIVKQMRKDYSGARQDAEAALRGDPRERAALNLLMQAQVAQNENAKALDSARKIVRESNEPAMQVLAGQWLARLGKAEEARGVFSAVSARQPGYTPAELAAALVDIGDGKAEDAKSRLLALIKKEPQNDTALLLLANIEYSAKNYAPALMYFRSVVEMRPQNAMALNATAYLLAMSDPDQALKYAEEALALAPNDAAVQDTVGWVYYRKGTYGTAVSYLEKAVAKDPSPVHQFHLAMSYLKAGDRTRGSQLLNTVLAKNPNLTKTEQGW